MPTFHEPRRAVLWRADFMPQTLVKRPTEVRNYDFEFAYQPEITGGETLSSATVAATPTGLTLGAASIVGTKARLQISGGTDGVEYRLTCTAITSGSKTLVALGDLVVTTEGETT